VLEHVISGQPIEAWIGRHYQWAASLNAPG
jgi:hypothetical protein